jgi:hypothetical protein
MKTASTKPQIGTPQPGKSSRRRRLRLRLGVAIFATAVAAAPAGGAQLVTGNPALYWSSVVSSTMGGSPIITSRTIAMVQLAIFEAANATTGQKYNSYLNTGATGGDTRAAIAVAARNVLVAVNPSRTGEYDAALANALSLIPDGPDKTAGMATGATIATATIAKRANDGSALKLDYTPKAPGTPGAWQPTPPGDLAAALPEWQNVAPWVLKSTDQFLAAPPPALSSAEYAADFNEVKDWGGTVSALRTADQTTNALVWAGTGARSAILPWQDIAIQLAEGAGMTAEESARLLALLAMSNADTIIAVWDSKYLYDFWRPVTAIRNADIDGNAATLTDTQWMSRITTPNYPSQASGIAAVAGNAQTILNAFFNDANDFCIVAAAGQRCYNSFLAATQAAADARVHGGMHFRFETTAGLLQGRQVAGYTLANALGAVPEPGTWAMLILGFGAIGWALRNQQTKASMRMAM